MSCYTCNPPTTGPVNPCLDINPLCTPPTPVVTVVAGPQGPSGPIGPSGLLGPRGMTGMTGVMGPSGPKGDIGLQGNTGATGATGAAGSSAPLAFFSGAFWTPGTPYSNDLNSLPANKILDFGTIPFSTGFYLFHLEAQIGWNGNGNTYQNGTFDLAEAIGDPGAIRHTFYWSRLKVGGAGYNYGTVQSYSHWLSTGVTQGNHLYLIASNDAFLIGGQLTVFPNATYEISSPGFIN